MISEGISSRGTIFLSCKELIVKVSLIRELALIHQKVKYKNNLNKKI